MPTIDKPMLEAIVKDVLSEYDIPETDFITSTVHFDLAQDTLKNEIQMKIIKSYLEHTEENN